MTEPPDDRPRIPGYEFTSPMEADAVAALIRVFGPQQGREVWRDVCRAARVPEGMVRAEDMPRLADALVSEPGAVSAVGRSLQIRLRTHARLAERAARTRTGASA
jgi:hypothetical protein